MFSSRTGWETALNPMGRHLAERRAAGLEVIDLTESNPTRCGFAYLEREVLPLLSEPALLRAALRYEPQPKGDPEARRAIARYYLDKGAMLDAEQIVLTASTSEAYSFLFRLLADPGNEVLVPAPSYPLFDYLAGLNDLKLGRYRLVYERGWRIEQESLRQAIRPETRAIIVVNPNNPTGSFLKRSELAALVETCRERDLALISDEVFFDYSFNGTEDAASAAGCSDILTFALNGLSKSVGLPQLKIAWIAASGPSPLLQSALARLEIIADTYLSTNTLSQLALPRLLERRQSIRDEIRRRVTDNRRHLLGQLDPDGPVKCLQAEGGWYAVLRLPLLANDEELALELLDRDGVLVHPGYLFDFEREGHIVISLLVQRELFAEGICRLLERIGHRYEEGARS